MWFLYVSSVLSSSFAILKPSNTGEFNGWSLSENETQNKSFYWEQSELNNQRPISKKEEKINTKMV